MANSAIHQPSIERAGSLPSVFHKYKTTLHGPIKQALLVNDLAVYDILRYSMGWADVDGNPTDGAKGKSLRPTLCLFSCEATGGAIKKAMPAAVSLELIHNFSLIHDDIQDGDQTRHHRPTAWAVWGEPKALVAGNVLRVIADMSLGGLTEQGLSHADALMVTSLLTEAYLQMIEGQYLDLSYEGQPDIALESYLGMISRKTGALIRCAMNLGAFIGTQDRATVRAFRECGASLGFVFQIRDDVLGVWGTEENTGKPVGSDIRRKKNSLPIVYAMSRAEKSDKDRLLQIYSQKVISDDDLTTVLEIMGRLNTRQFAQDLAARHCEKAMQAIATIDLGDS